MSSTDALARLHDHYVEAVNLAVADDDQARIDRLAAEYDVELAQLLQRPAA